jgi:hypothetical protein
VKYGGHLIDIGFIGGGADHRVDHPRGNVYPDVRLHPEVPLAMGVGGGPSIRPGGLHLCGIASFSGQN